MSSLRTLRTRGSGATSAEGLSVTMSGWLGLTSRAGPQFGSSSRHSRAVGSAGPTIEEQRLDALHTEVARGKRERRSA